MTNKMSYNNVLEILCVEDDDCIREFMVAELHEAFQDARIDVASDGAEALSKCIERTPSILITNVVKNHNMNGFELIKALFGRNIEVPIIVTSEFYSSDDLAKNGIQLKGNVRFIKKSSSFAEDLVREVNSIVKST